MANEIEEKKVEEKKEQSENSVEEKSCGLKYLEDFEKLENMGFSFENAGYIAFLNLNKCLGL